MPLQVEIADPETKTATSISPEVHEEKQVIVHCSFECPAGEGQLIRIWPSTFLVDRNSSHRSKLLFWDNISLFPNWMPVEGGQTHRFTLIFSGLPSSCVVFDFIEEIPQDGGFFVSGLIRNGSDVYHIRIN